MFGKLKCALIGHSWGVTLYGAFSWHAPSKTGVHTRHFKQCTACGWRVSRPCNCRRDGRGLLRERADAKAHRGGQPWVDELDDAGAFAFHAEDFPYLMLHLAGLAREGEGVNEAFTCDHAAYTTDRVPVPPSHVRLPEADIVPVHCFGEPEPRVLEVPAPAPVRPDGQGDPGRFPSFPPPPAPVPEIRSFAQEVSGEPWSPPAPLAETPVYTPPPAPAYEPPRAPVYSPSYESNPSSYSSSDYGSSGGGYDSSPSPSD